MKELIKQRWILFTLIFVTVGLAMAANWVEPPSNNAGLNHAYGYENQNADDDVGNIDFPLDNVTISDDGVRGTYRLNFTDSVGGTSTPLGTGLNLSLYENFTWEAWLSFPNSPAGASRYIWSNVNITAGGSEAIWVYVNTGTGGLCYETLIQPTTGPLLCHNRVFNQTAFHFAVVQNDTTVTTYIDGVKNKTGAKNVWHELTGAELQIIMGIAPSGAVSSLFNFSIDNLMIWNVSRTINEIHSDMNATFEETTTVNLVSPANATTIVISDHNFSAEINATGGSLNVSNATFQMWYDNGTLFNETFVSVASGSISTVQNFSIFNIGVNDYHWNVLGCSADGSKTVCNYGSSNFTFSRGSFSEDANTFPNQVYDTDNSTFEINITAAASSSLFSATLIYNNTAYPTSRITETSSGVFNVKRKIDIPVLPRSQNVSFFWNFTFDVGGGFSQQSSTTQQHNVTITNFTMVGTNGFTAVNFSIFDEETLAAINVDLDAQFLWWLGDGTVRKNDTFSNHSSTFRFFNHPESRQFNTRSILELENETGVSPYHFRIYEFMLEQYTSDTTEQELFLLNTTTTSSIARIEVTDEGGRPISDYSIKLWRFYPSDGKYRLVESKITGASGFVGARIVENNVIYKLEIRDSNNVLKRVVEQAFSCRNTLCIIPFTITTSSPGPLLLQNITNHVYTNIAFDNATNIFSFTFDDDTGHSNINHRLRVDRVSINGTTIVCNNTGSSYSTALEGQVTCNVGSQGASYNAYAYRYSDELGTVLLDVNTDVIVGGSAAIFGLEGLIWSAIFLLTMILIGVATGSPVIAMFLYMAGIMFMRLTQIIYINNTIFIANLVIGGLFIWVFSRR